MRWKSTFSLTSENSINLSAFNVIVEWDEDFSETKNGTQIRLVDKATSKSVISNYVTVVKPNGNLIPNNATRQELEDLFSFNKIRKLKEGDRLMVKHQYKTPDTKLPIDGNYYTIPLESIVCLFGGGEIVMYNGYSFVEMDEGSQIKGVIAHSSSFKSGQRVIIKGGVRTESDLFKKYGYIRVEDSHIINIK